MDGAVKRLDRSEPITVPSNATTYIAYDVNDQTSTSTFFPGGGIYLHPPPPFLKWTTVVCEDDFDGNSLLASVGKLGEDEKKEKWWYHCIYDILHIGYNVFRLEDGVSTEAIWARLTRDMHHRRDRVVMDIGVDPIVAAVTRRISTSPI